MYYQTDKQPLPLPFPRELLLLSVGYAPSTLVILLPPYRLHPAGIGIFAARVVKRPPVRPILEAGVADRRGASPPVVSR
jgi:hypothetical protein